MSRLFLSAFLVSFGILALIGSAIGIGLKGITVSDLLLLSLTIPAVWLRIRLEPTGDLTLAPVVILTSFLLGTTFVPVAVAALAAVVGVLLARQRSGEGLEAMGEETLPVALGVAIVMSVNAYWQPISISRGAEFGLEAFVYIFARMLIATLRAKVMEDVEIKSFLSHAGRSMLGNLAFFSLVALGLAHLKQRLGSAGYLPLALVTVALIEAYHPYKLLSDQRDVLFASLTMIAQAVDLKDAYTGKHAREASNVAVRIARTLRLPEGDVRKIRFAATLHDIGKIGVSAKIIRKPSRLDPEEMVEMQRHPMIGAGIMKPIELLAEAAETVLHHHEHYDGSGYPGGLRGEQIPIGSRVVLVADAFNAITTDRPYRKARSKKEALNELRDHSGKQFDPRVVGALESIIANL
jgi:HD-GYP domain-containing protein (c-di-GMP phosphodiesterase class II)